MIKTTKKDVVWNYIGTVVSMGSGFILLPFLMYYLGNDELGLWYVYTAIANLALLFEFGFNPTFARNIVFVVSGARKLTAEGRDKSSVEEGIDWHLLNTTIKTSKYVYGVIASIVLILLVIFGSMYIGFITSEIDFETVWTSWAIFCIAIFFNLFFLYSFTMLRGYGDIAGENKARTFAKLSQLLFSGILLACGAGLIGAAIGYLINSVLIRALTFFYIGKHKEIETERKKDSQPVSFAEVKIAFSSIGHIAWRDGFVSIANYISNQGMSIMCSLFLGLAETGTYSILLQLANAVYSFACAYPRSFFPSMQSAFMEGDSVRQRQIVSRSISAYWFLILFGAVGVCLIVIPILLLFKPGIELSYWLFLGLTLYLALCQQQSLFCSYIVCRNEIPYAKALVVFSLLSLPLVYLFCSYFQMGAWGIVLGQFTSQVVYNNWKWPRYLCRELSLSYPQLLKNGFSYWCLKILQLKKGDTTI